MRLRLVRILIVVDAARFDAADCDLAAIPSFADTDAVGGVAGAFDGGHTGYLIGDDDVAAGAAIAAADAGRRIATGRSNGASVNGDVTAGGLGAVATVAAADACCIDAALGSDDATADDYITAGNLVTSADSAAVESAGGVGRTGGRETARACFLSLDGQGLAHGNCDAGMSRLGFCRRLCGLILDSEPTNPFQLRGLQYSCLPQWPERQQCVQTYRVFAKESLFAGFKRSDEYFTNPRRHYSQVLFYCIRLRMA